MKAPRKLRPLQIDSYKPLRELVCEALSDAIRQGILKPGDRLMENQLADDLGVSRTPIREAMRQLEIDGYVIMIPRRGTYVSDLTMRDINEVFEIRATLEALAGQLAAKRITPEEIEQLKNLLAQIETIAQQKKTLEQMDDIVKYDMQFHEILYQASRNKRLVDIISNLREQVRRFRKVSMSFHGRIFETIKEHRAIVQAIEKQDADEARLMAKLHIEKSEQTFLASMEEMNKTKK